jgi:methyl acetate hydrolase
MTPQLPSLSRSGTKTLDKLLHERVALNETPAVFWLATNAEEEIYSNQAGLRTFGDESSGQVHADTSEFGLP